MNNHIPAGFFSTKTSKEPLRLLGRTVADYWYGICGEFLFGNTQYVSKAKCPAVIYNGIMGVWDYHPIILIQFLINQFLGKPIQTQVSLLIPLAWVTLWRIIFKWCLTFLTSEAKWSWRVFCCVIAMTNATVLLRGTYEQLVMEILFSFAQKHGRNESPQR